MLGVSSGIAGFFARRPDQFDAGALLRTDLPDQQEMTERLLGSVDASEGFARADRPEAALRVAYRRCLAEVIAADMASPDAAAAIPAVSAALADAAAAALEAALAVARTAVARESGRRDEVVATRLAIIGMGKAGARELNYVSDVDVIFVAGTRDEDVVGESRAIDVATRLARETMRVLSGIDTEPPL